MLRRTPSDSVPIARVMVVLHRVGQDVQGPVDSVESDASGRFRMRIRPDTSAIYLLSARYLGVDYFAPPLFRDAQHPDRNLLLMVYDTSSTIALTVSSRHLVVGAVDQSGSRAVADLILLENQGMVTRLAGDFTHPAWRMPLPRRALEIELGEGDFAMDAVVQRSDSLLLAASIPPGMRQLTLTYRIPGDVSRFEIPIDRDLPSVVVLAEDSAMVVRGGFVRRDTMTVAGRRFTTWDGALRGGEPLVLHFPAPSGRSTWVLPAMIALLAAGLVGVGVATSRRPPAAGCLARTSGRPSIPRPMPSWIASQPSMPHTPAVPAASPLRNGRRTGKSVPG